MLLLLLLKLLLLDNWLLHRRCTKGIGAHVHVGHSHIHCAELLLLLLGKGVDLLLLRLLLNGHAKAHWLLLLLLHHWRRHCIWHLAHCGKRVRHLARRGAKGRGLLLLLLLG